MQLGEPLYRKQEPTGYSNAGQDWMNSASLLARMNFAIALAGNRIPGVKVDAARFGDASDTDQIAGALMLTDLSDTTRAAIQAGLERRRTQRTASRSARLRSRSPSRSHRRLDAGLAGFSKKVN